MRLSANVLRCLRCPACRAELTASADGLTCRRVECAARYPVEEGIPVLIDEKSSVFTFDDFLSHKTTFFDLTPVNRLKRFARRLIPTVSLNVRGRGNYRRFARMLLQASPAPRVLVIGGSVLGQGMEYLVRHREIELVESDVSFGPRTSLICDAHDLPFADASFDGVIVQAVLEHVVDPYRCVEEVHRVLGDRGLVYAETPFMQQVHGGRFDFTRFTHLGHRRVFRKFEEVDSGAACGPGMALAWSYQYFLMSFASSRPARALLRTFASFTSFFLKYLDHHLVGKPAALDAASGYFFLGRKSNRVLSDRELISLYRGAV